MYKDSEKQKEANRKSMQRRRQGITEGITPEPGITPKGITSEGITGQGITESEIKEEGITGHPDIIDKLTDPVWRPRLEAICLSFNQSHHPDYMHDVYLGGINLSKVCELLEVTR